MVPEYVWWMRRTAGHYMVYRWSMVSPKWLGQLLEYMHVGNRTPSCDSWSAVTLGEDRCVVCDIPVSHSWSNFIPRYFEHCSLPANLQQICESNWWRGPKWLLLQDGATCYTSDESMTEIRSFLRDRIISKDLWPPRSPDLFPPNFFLWGALKGKVYVNKPRTRQELETNIWREVAGISEDALQVTFANMQRRVRLCLDSSGGHFQHLQ
jgi:hypothetical protein